MPVSTALLIAGAVVLVADVAGVALRAQDGRRRSGGAVPMRAEDLPGGLTTTFLIDASGAVLSRWGGIPERRSIEDAVAAVPTVRDAVSTVHRQEQS